VNRKKIIYIIGGLSKGGAERQLYELVKSINRDKFDPVVISLSEGGYWSKEIQKLNIQLIEIPRKKNKEFKRLFKLIKLLKSMKPDIVHTYMFSANSYGRIAAILTRVPIIIASERSLPEIGKDKSRYQISIDKLFASFSHGIICNSYVANKILITKYSFDTKKVFTVHNGIDVGLFFRENSKNQKKLARKVVGTIGRIDALKNHKLLLDMAKNVLDKSNNKDIKFLIVGEGPLRDELERHSQNLGIENKIVFTGERNDIPDLLQMMDVFVLTSNWEGLSNAIMEAMASSLPCVATDVGGNSELVLDGETGYIVSPNDPGAAAQKVLYLINDRLLAKEMGVKGRKRIEESFSAIKMIKNTEEVYDKLLIGRS